MNSWSFKPFLSILQNAKTLLKDLETTTEELSKDNKVIHASYYTKFIINTLHYCI